MVPTIETRKEYFVELLRFFHTAFMTMNQGILDFWGKGSC